MTTHCWYCRARNSNTDPPQDCDWPFCGCDETAARVLEALNEQGKLVAPEIVICAAWRCQDGTVIRGHRHGHALQVASQLGRLVSRDPEDQGFISSRNRFVGRTEAFQLQRAAGIESVAPGGYRGTVLYSEDLY